MERNEFSGISDLSQLRACRRAVEEEMRAMEKSCWRSVLLEAIRGLKRKLQ